MRQSLGDLEPTIHASAYVHPDATVIGDVTLAADSSAWPGTVLRGDEGAIVLREGTNIQDNAVCHEHVAVGPYATVGHGAILHGCDVGEEALIGMNAVVLDRSTVGDRAIVAAGSVVTEDTDVPPGSLVAGTPAQVVTEDVGESGWHAAGQHYADLAERYRESAEPLEE